MEELNDLLGTVGSSSFAHRKVEFNKIDSREVVHMGRTFIACPFASGTLCFAVGPL